jgi:hypothetical protein
MLLSSAAHLAEHMMYCCVLLLLLLLCRDSFKPSSESRRTALLLKGSGLPEELVSQLTK